MVANWFVERNDTRRPCIADGRKCLFHRWSTESQVIAPSPFVGGHPGGVVAETVGILEFEDGTVEKWRVGSFKFDDGGQFLQWAWNSDNEGIGRPTE